MPAFGIATSGSVVSVRMRSIDVSTVAGPTLQLQPMASAPASVSRCAACSGVLPSRQFASSSTVISTITGSCGATSRAASDRLLRLVQRHHRLEDQQIDSALRQRRNLFGKRRPRLVRTQRSERLQPHAQRTHRACDKRLRRLLFADRGRRTAAPATRRPG